MKLANIEIKETVGGNQDLKGVFSRLFFQKVTASLNRLQGSNYEKMAAAIILRNAVEYLDLREPDILLDRKVFDCFDLNLRRRRCDIYLQNAEVAYEIKSYRPCYSSFVRDQISKDEWLLKNHKINQIWWLLFQGATRKVLQELTRCGIIFISATAEDDHFTNIPLIFKENANANQVCHSCETIITKA